MPTEILKSVIPLSRSTENVPFVKCSRQPECSYTTAAHCGSMVLNAGSLTTHPTCAASSKHVHWRQGLLLESVRRPSCAVAVVPITEHVKLSGPTAPHIRFICTASRHPAHRNSDTAVCWCPWCAPCSPGERYSNSVIPHSPARECP